MQIVDIEGHSRRCRDFGDQIVSAFLLRVDCQFEESSMRASPLIGNLAIQPIGQISAALAMI